MNRGAVPGLADRPVQLALPIVLDGDPTRPARWVAAMLGVPLQRLMAAIETGELPARHDGQQWQVPLWSIPTFRGSLA